MLYFLLWFTLALGLGLCLLGFWLAWEYPGEYPLITVVCGILCLFIFGVSIYTINLKPEPRPTQVSAPANCPAGGTWAYTEKGITITTPCPTK